MTSREKRGAEEQYEGKQEGMGEWELGRGVARQPTSGLVSPGAGGAEMACSPPSPFLVLG